MHGPAPASSAHDIDMVSAMVECAYGLGMAAGEIARGCKDTKAFLEASAEFRQCFFAVRMGIRLKLNLSAAAKPAVVERAQAEVVEREIAEDDRPERDPSERERESEGDREPVSLPQFLKSLGVVAKAAERRKDQLPRELATEILPRLHGLLAQANGGGAVPDAKPTSPAGRPSAVAVLERPQSPPRTRSRLLGSSAAPPRGPPPRASG
jgi:hypothetical protein